MEGREERERERERERLNPVDYVSVEEHADRDVTRASRVDRRSLSARRPERTKVEGVQSD